MICAIIIKRSPVKGKNIEHLEKKEKYIFSMPLHIFLWYLMPLSSTPRQWTCLNQTYLGPVFMFVIDRCLVYTGKINKDFLYSDFIESYVYKVIQFIQRYRLRLYIIISNYTDMGLLADTHLSPVVAMFVNGLGRNEQSL